MFPSTEIKASETVGNSFYIGFYSKRLLRLVPFVLYTQMVKNAIAFRGLIKYFSDGYEIEKRRGALPASKYLSSFHQFGASVPLFRPTKTSVTR